MGNKPTQTTDSELKVLLKCHEGLNRLYLSQVKRVLLYLAQRHELHISNNNEGIWVNLK